MFSVHKRDGNDGRLGIPPLVMGWALRIWIFGLLESPRWVLEAAFNAGTQNMTIGLEVSVLASRGAKPVN